MKTSAKNYAQALYESVKGKNEKEAKSAITGLVSILSARQHFSLVEAICREFKKIYNNEEGIIEAEIRTVRKIGKETEKELTGYIKELSQAAKVELSEIEDKDLIGGMVIKYGDKILDLSLKAKLSLLKGGLKK